MLSVGPFAPKRQRLARHPMVTFCRAVTLRSYVEAGPVRPENFEVIELPMPSADAVEEGGVLCKLQLLSVDPYMRGRMRNVPGYFVGPFQPGQPLDGRGVAEVLVSKAPHLPAGCQVVSDVLKWQDVQAVGKDVAARLKPLDVTQGTPLTAYLGPLGAVGMTAYCSLLRIAKPKQGEVAYVSGAAGAVGSLVGQLLKNVYGCKVVGSAGSDDKVAFLKSIGYDDAFNYKTAKGGIEGALVQLCPNGIDIYFDNVGGETLEAALEHMNLHGRVVACGAISQYDPDPKHRYGVKNLFQVVAKRLLMQGFIAFDYMAEGDDVVADFERHMSEYMKEGKIVVKEVFKDGLEKAGEAFCEMMAGGNTGKMIVRV